MILWDACDCGKKYNNIILDDSGSGACVAPDCRKKWYKTQLKPIFSVIKQPSLFSYETVFVYMVIVLINNGKTNWKECKSRKKAEELIENIKSFFEGKIDKIKR